MKKKQTKNCSKCGQPYPITSEFFRPSKSCLNGLSNVCRICFAKYKRYWKEKTYRYKVGPRSSISFKDRINSDPILKKSVILRSGVLARSKELGLAFDCDFFTRSFFYDELTKNPFCECCGKEFYFSGDGLSMDAPSVDRLRPAVGYVKGNVSIICWRCNKIKRDASLDELKILLRWMKDVAMSQM